MCIYKKEKRKREGSKTVSEAEEKKEEEERRRVRRKGDIFEPVASQLASRHFPATPGVDPDVKCGGGRLTMRDTREEGQTGVVRCVVGGLQMRYLGSRVGVGLTEGTAEADFAMRFRGM